MELSSLVTLTISSLRSGNTFFYRAHILYGVTLWCYTQHDLRPYIDSEINQFRHYIKIQCVNKGIEFINLPCIFKDKSVISYIPIYFKNQETPIICFNYNEPIRNIIKL